MSSSRSRTRTFTSRFTIALSAPALMLAAIAAGGGFSASAAAQPAGQVRAIGQAFPAARTGTSAALHQATAAGLTGISSAADVASTLSTRAVLAVSAHPRLGRNRLIAWRMMHHRFGWRSRYQFRFLNRLWDRESGWYVYATNPYSGAYGIPQAVPGSKMASAGPNWRTSARTQIRWGLRYIKGRYGSPRRAWGHEVTYGWY